MLDLPTFNAALASAGSQPVTADLLALLTQTINAAALEGLIFDAQRGAALAKATLRHHGACLRIVHCLHKLDYPSASLADASRLLGAQGEERLRAALVGARQGAAGPLAQLAVWMLPTVPGRVAAPAAPSPATVSTPSRKTVPVTYASHLRLAAAVSPVSTTPLSTTQVNDSAPLTFRRARQVKVYGTKAGLTLVADQTRAGQATVCIEAAAAKPDVARGYDWSTKLRFQLTLGELQLVTALLFSCLPTVRFQHPGGKWLQLTMQEPRSRHAGLIRVALGEDDAQGKRVHAVAIDPHTLGEVMGLFLHQCALALGTAENTVLHIIRCVAEAHSLRSGEIRSGYIGLAALPMNGGATANGASATHPSQS
ncbi:MAG: hypothetical protein WC617_11610 [Rhodanobacter sp.]|jgi:hypothetical protein